MDNRVTNDQRELDFVDAASLQEVGQFAGPRADPFERVRVTGRREGQPSRHETVEETLGRILLTDGLLPPRGRTLE